MRDAIGADAARVLPLLDTHSFTFLIEDPATVWHLGAERYPTIAERYRALRRAATSWPSTSISSSVTRTCIRPSSRRASSCSNWCTSAAASFARVALYFENSLLPPDLAAAVLGRGRGDAHRAAGPEDRDRIALGRWAPVEGGGQGGRRSCGRCRTAKRSGCPAARTCCGSRLPADQRPCVCCTSMRDLEVRPVSGRRKTLEFTYQAGRARDRDSETGTGEALRSMEWPEPCPQLHRPCFCLAASTS